MNKKNDLKVVALNTQGLRKKKELISKFVTQNDIDVLILTETWMIEHPDFLNYKKIDIPAVPDNRGLPRRGLCVYWKSTLPTLPTKLPRHDQKDTICHAIKLKRNSSPLTIIGVYHAPAAAFQIEQIRHFFNNTDSVLILGDLNAHHPDINIDHSDSVNPAGIAVVNKLMEQDGLCLLNDEKPTHDRGNRLDLALADPNLQNILASFSILNDQLSDHLPICVTLSFESKNDPTRKTIRDWTNVDLMQFQITVAEKMGEIDELDTPDQIDLAVETLTTAFQEAVEVLVPEKEIKIRKSYVRKTTIALIQRRRRIRHIFQRTRDPRLKSDINKLGRLAKENLQADMEWFQQKLKQNTAKYRNQPKKFWSNLSTLMGRKKPLNPIVLQKDNKLITDNKEVSNILADHLAAVSTKPTEPTNTDLTDEMVNNHRRRHPAIYDLQQTPIFDETFLTQQQIDLIKPIRRFEIDNAMKMKDKAPGETGIRITTITKGGLPVLDRLRLIFNAALKIGHFPTPLKRAQVVAIPKPGKDAKSATSYRPISLLPIIGKILERIINERLTDYLEKEKIIVSSQMGFRRRRGVTDQTTILTHDIAEGRQKRKKIAVVTFDVEKAFDKTWQEGLLYKMTKMKKFPDRLLRLLNSYLTNRTLKVKVENSISDERIMSAGTPQGSILSPTLFLLMVNDLKDVTDTTRVKSKQFADDISLIDAERTISQLQGNLQVSIDHLTTWSKRWRVKLNAAKSKVLLISRRKNDENNLTLTMDGVPLTYDPTIRYLGVTYNKQGNGNSHAKEIRRKTAPLIKKLTMISYDKKLPPDLTIQIYKTYIRPIIDFAAPAWTGSLSNTSRRSLEALQRRALKAALGLPIWTPTFFLDQEVQPFDITNLTTRWTQIGRQFLTKTPYIDQLMTGYFEHRLKNCCFPVYGILN